MSDGPTHDVLVIGAGPAGATAALRARQLGLSVALIDKSRFPRDKLCGGGITGRCRDHLDAVFSPLDPAIWLPATRVRMVAGPALVADLQDAPTICYTMRRDFDAALVTQALAAGAEDLTGQRIRHIDPDAVQIVTEAGRVLRGRVMIGADGVNSAVARALFGRAHDPQQIGFALETELPITHGSADPVAILDVTAAQWGYAWIFPKADSLTLGIGGVHGRNPALKETFRAWLLAQGHDPDSLTIKGHHLPFGDPRPAPGRGAVILAGDAAGLVDPITGEGIAWAIRSGHLAAEAAAFVVGFGQPAQALALYAPRLAPVLAELTRARKLARLIYHPLMQRRFVAVLSRSERLQRRYFDLLAGRMDYADLSMASFGRILWRMLRGG